MFSLLLCSNYLIEILLRDDLIVYVSSIVLSRFYSIFIRRDLAGHISALVALLG
jgi:hypothetical protein